MTKHLAILTQPFLNLILEGKKTIESRFSKVRCAPHGVVQSGDVVLMKKPGGKVLGQFTVGKVLYFPNITPEQFQKVKSYGKEICAEYDPHFWESRKAARYVTLMAVTNVIRYQTPVPVVKKDKRGWVVMREAYQPTLFDTFEKTRE